MIPSERVIVNKERASGSYRLSSYFAAKMLSELPLNVLLPSFYLFIVYWACGLNPTPTAFFWDVVHRDPPYSDHPGRRRGLHLDYVTIFGTKL
eukprot:Em0008g1004a